MYVVLPRRGGPPPAVRLRMAPDTSAAGGPRARRRTACRTRSSPTCRTRTGPGTGQGAGTAAGRRDRPARPGPRGGRWPNCSGWRARRTRSRSSPAGRRCPGRPPRSWARRTASRSSWTCAGTARTRWSPAPRGRGACSSCAAGSPRSPSPTGRTRCSSSWSTTRAAPRVRPGRGTAARHQPDHRPRRPPGRAGPRPPAGRAALPGDPARHLQGPGHQDYHDMRDRGRELPPLPRLVFVIAEYSALGLELPELMVGLMNVAQRGRSLGVHLVLSPSAPWAALSPHPGGDQPADRPAGRQRGGERHRHRRTGARGDPPVDPGPGLRAHGRRRTAGVPGRHAGELGPRRPSDRMIPSRRSTTRDLPTPPPAGPPSGSGAVRTDLGLLVSAVTTAARLAEVPAVPGPLPEQLPLVVTLSELPAQGGAVAGPGAGRVRGAGVRRRARRQPALFDLAASGPLAAVGAPRSGKSQFLRTLAAALAVRHGAADVHLFGIDCGNGALQAISRLPHCGAVVTRGRPDHMARLVSRLTAALYSRQQLFAEGGFGDIAAQRQAVPRSAGCRTWCCCSTAGRPSRTARSRTAGGCATTWGC